MSPNTRMRLWWDKYLAQKLNYTFKHSWKYSASKNISKSSRNIFKPLIFKQPKKYFQTNHFQTTKKIFSNQSFSNNQKNIFKQPKKYFQTTHFQTTKKIFSNHSFSKIPDVWRIKKNNRNESTLFLPKMA